VLTLFTIPKSFKGHIDVIQRNAIQSWKRLHPGIEIILFGADEGVAEIACEFAVRHEPHVEHNEFGSCLVNSMFAKAQAIGRHDLLCYINCDILLLDDFCRAIQSVRVAHQEFLMVGRRTDVDIFNPWPFERSTWQAELRDFAARHGKRRTPNFIDYFAFSRGLYGPDLPPLAVGRAHWDNWAIWKVLHSKLPVVDASAVVTVMHQNHDYNHHPQGQHGVYYGEEAARNAQLAGGWGHLRTIAHASETLGVEGLRPNTKRHWAEAKRRGQWVGRVFLYDVWQPAWFGLLGLTRPLRNALGFRRQ
jgi:hypothetical protein